MVLLELDTDEPITTAALLGVNQISFPQLDVSSESNIHDEGQNNHSL